MTRSDSNKEKLTCWLLDTRPLWADGTKISETAQEALQLIPPSERETCLRKYHLADAKMSLASALLKRLYVSETLNIPWHDVRYGRKNDPTHGKPCALLPDGSQAPIEFNVSHQAGLVTLVGYHPRDGGIDEGVELGVDIVCVNERNDYRTIDSEGFGAWVDIYAEVFSSGEISSMKSTTDPFPLLDGTEISAANLSPQTQACSFRNQELVARLEDGELRKFSSELLIDAKLRRFYTYWCFKEAYIKLDGEALLAKWIKELEFRKVRAPRQGTAPRCSTLGVWGEKVSDTEVWLTGKKLDDVRVEIRAFEENYMIAVAAKPREVLPEALTNFETLHLERDVLEYARSH